MDPATIAALTQAGIAAGQAVTRGGPRRQYKWNKKAMKDAQKINRANQKWVLAQNERLSQEQRIYDSPASQMARFKAAGLNPHLIYGQGSPGNMGSPISVGSAPPANIDAPDASYPDLFGGYLQAGQQIAQTGLTLKKAVESEKRAELVGVQKAIAANNPMLNPSVVERTIDVIMSVGELKLKQNTFLMQNTYNPDDPAMEANPRYQQIIDADIIAMWQKLGLNKADKELKNAILDSKEYENALKEIQVKWMKDGNITPQHIYQGLLLLLSKMM